MKTNTGENMSGAPIGTPGSAEGVDEEKGQAQSQTPPAAHTPGSAEGEDDEDKSGIKPQPTKSSAFADVEA